MRRVLGFGLARVVTYLAIGLPGRRGASGVVSVVTVRHDWYIDIQKLDANVDYVGFLTDDTLLLMHEKYFNFF